MHLYKAHGAGNDFVVVPDRAGAIELTADAVVALCDRHRGIGADGVLRLAPAEDAHVFMDYRNGGDGSPVEMCGNGVRVVAAHLVEHGWTTDRTLRIGTRAGVRTAVVTTDADGRVTEVDVDMGPPRFGPAAVGLDVGEVAVAAGADVVLLEVGDEPIAVMPVSMGNPHVVLQVDDPAAAPVRTLGPRIETDPRFAQGTNVEFVSVRDRRSIDLRVWERGVGETLACGTGVCGAVAALTRAGRLDPDVDVTVTVPGGTLRVRWGGAAEDAVHLIGPAVEVATIRPSAGLAAATGLTIDAAATT